MWDSFSHRSARYLETAQDADVGEDGIWEGFCAAKCAVVTGTGASISARNHGTWGIGVLQMSGRDVALVAETIQMARQYDKMMSVASQLG